MQEKSHKMKTQLSFLEWICMLGYSSGMWFQMLVGQWTDEVNIQNIKNKKINVKRLVKQLTKQKRLELSDWRVVTVEVHEQRQEVGN